jgi:hypothetical protein
MYQDIVKHETANFSPIERYRNAVAMKSRAEEYRRTAVQYCDTYRAIHNLNYWTAEVEEARAKLSC